VLVLSFPGINTLCIGKYCLNQPPPPTWADYAFYLGSLVQQFMSDRVERAQYVLFEAFEATQETNFNFLTDHKIIVGFLSYS